MEATTVLTRKNTNITRRKVTKPSKKILLGKPITSTQQKMTLEELKALSRQIRPLNSSSCTKANTVTTTITTTTTANDIMLISKNLRENLTKAKSKMMANLSKSNEPKDIEIYEYLSKESPYSPTTPSLSPPVSDMEDVEDDFNSRILASTTTKLCGPFTFAISSSSLLPSSSCSASTVSSYDDEEEELDVGEENDYMPLYTPDLYAKDSLINMELLFPTGLSSSLPQWESKQQITEGNDTVTEDQINSWLQRGGFGGSGGETSPPMTMATDQELAGKVFW